MTAIGTVDAPGPPYLQPRRWVPVGRLTGEETTVEQTPAGDGGWSGSGSADWSGSDGGGSSGSSGSSGSDGDGSSGSWDVPGVSPEGETTAASAQEKGSAPGSGPSWQSPGQPQYGQPQYGQPQYGQPQYGQPPYGQPQYGQPQGPPPSGQQPPANPYAGYQPLYKPGVIPLRPLGLGEILDGSFATIRQNPGATLGLSAVVVTVTQLLLLLLQLTLDPVSSAGKLALSGVGLVIQLAGVALLSGALTIVVSESVLGSKISAADAFRRVRPRAAGVIGLTLLYLLVVVLAVFTIVGGIYLAVALSLGTPVYVLERQGVRASLRRSRQLVKGAWWRQLGILLLAYLITNVITAILVIPLALFGLSGGGAALFTSSGDVSSTARIVIALYGILTGTVVRPIAAGVIALLYVDRRMRSEGLDVTLAQAARERAAGR